jgi:iron complex outermembrane receptor protein
MAVSARLVLAGAGVLFGMGAAHADPEPDEHPAYETVVTASTPLHGSGLPREMFPSNVQTGGHEALSAAHSVDLTEYLEREMGSVTVAQVQANPLQADLLYRGFSASPVLGAPQGLALYLDGVRLNEPFGDGASWDILPLGAIRSINLMPGSNPLFGLNALGGALSLQTEDGFSQPGAAAHLLGGSFGRRSLAFEGGVRGERLALFVAGDALAEDGWRDRSPSDAKHLYGSLAFRGERSSANLSVLAADTTLLGEGPAPVQLLAMRRAAVFTHPDRTTHRALLATWRGERELAEAVRVSALAYLRASRLDTLNGDQGRWAPCADRPDTVCTSDEGSARAVADQAGQAVAWDPVHAYDASENTTGSRQQATGGALQLAVERPVLGHDNHLFLGATADQGRASFTAQTALARLSSTRGALPADIVDSDSRVAVDTVVSSLGAFVSDTLALRPRLFLTAAARLGTTHLTLEDRLGGPLSGAHAFTRLNPAAGLSYQPLGAFGLFGGYSEAARAPTPLEVTCASRDAPCRLPNGFVSDPPLDQVVARTLEAGVRGRVERSRFTIGYDGALFRTTTDDDLLFVSAGPLTNQGYFDNVGRTRRQGVEAGAHGEVTLGAGLRLDWLARYSLLDATYQSAFTTPGTNHPDAVQGALAVVPGDRLPGVPRHQGKGSVDLLVPGRFSIGAAVIAASGRTLRGDDVNRLAPIPGSVLLELRASYQVLRQVRVFGRMSNALGASYATFGVLGDATTVLGPAFDSPRFESPGAPRAGWVGVDLLY